MLDALAVMLGLMAASYVDVETSGFLPATMRAVGNRGRIMLPDLVRMRVALSLALLVTLLTLSLLMLERWTPCARVLRGALARRARPPPSPPVRT